MPSTSAIGFKAFAFFAFLVAILGGFWFGLFSCGGYVWHKQLMQWTLAGLVLALLFWPAGHSTTLGRKALLALAVISAFFVVQALAAPFYPAFPDFGDYFQLVWLALSTGPC